MRKLSALLLIVCLFAPVLAGEVNTPGKTDPPPCTENCPTNTATSTAITTEEEIALALLELALTITRL